MNCSSTKEALPIIQELDAYCSQAAVCELLKERGTTLFEKIAATQPYAVVDIPLTSLPAGIPKTLGSMRIAAFFPNVQTKIERHPNSQ